MLISTVMFLTVNDVASSTVSVLELSPAAVTPLIESWEFEVK